MLSLTQLLNLVIFCIIFNLCGTVYSKPQNEEPIANRTAEEIKKDGETVRGGWVPDCSPPVCHHPHHPGPDWAGPYPRTGSEIFLHYMNVLKSCVRYNGLPYEVQQAVYKCKVDGRAEKNFDCFVLCVYVEIGALSPVRINAATYYTENFQCFLNYVNQLITVDRCTQADTITTILSCKSLMNRRHGWYDLVSYPPPPPFLYPDLDNCDALHGTFRCAYLNFFSLHHCSHKREDQEWLVAVRRNLTEAEEIDYNEDSTIPLKLV